jgi:hypothetical protein
MTTMLLSTAGFAGSMAWMPFLSGASPDTVPVSEVESAQPTIASDAETLPVQELARRKARCAGCGLIESIRETEGRPGSASREITVRLEDGSSRVIVDANPGRLRLGERVTVIGAFDEPNR